jgi:hypothetical protein
MYIHTHLRACEYERLQHLQQSEHILEHQLVVSIPELSWLQVCPALQHPTQHWKLSEHE